MWKKKKMKNSVLTFKEIFEGKKKVLAPLVGGSDLSFRLLARKYGCEVTFTEMNIAKYFLKELNGTSKIKKKYVYEFDKTDRPLILQLGKKKKTKKKLILLSIFII